MENHTKPIHLETCHSNGRQSLENHLTGILILLISFIAIAGNGLVLISFSHCSKLRSQKGGYFIANLALSDFLCSVYVMFPSALSLFNENWTLDGVACKIHAIYNSMLLTVSNLSLAAINMDRAIAVSRPFDYGNAVTMCRVKIAVSYIWFHGLLLGAVSLIEDEVKFSNWELMCAPTWSYEHVTYSWIAAVMCFVLPSLLLLVSNFAIVYAIRRSRSVVFQNCVAADGIGDRLCIRSNTRTLRSLYFLVFVYFTCVFPYYLVKFSLLIGNSNKVPIEICLIPTPLLYSAAAINPLVYAILRKDHRKAFSETISMVMGKLKHIQEFLFSSPQQPLQW